MTDAAVLIVGYGNPLREDDGVGWLAAEQLALRFPEADVRQQHQLLPELADPLSRADLAIFIDAAAGSTPGRIDYESVEPAVAEGAFTHHVSPESLLAMARDLFGRCPPTYLFTVSAGEFGYRSELSPAVAAALPELVELITNCVGLWRGLEADHIASAQTR